MTSKKYFLRNKNIKILKTFYKTLIINDYLILFKIIKNNFVYLKNSIIFATLLFGCKSPFVKKCF